MRKLRLVLIGSVLVSSMLLPAVAPASTCGPKLACTAYRTVCEVAAQAGLQCVD